MGIVEPGADEGIDGVVTAAYVVGADVFGEWLFALVSGLPALVAGEDFYVVVFFAALDAGVAVGRLPFVKVFDIAGGLALVVAGDASVGESVLDGEPFAGPPRARIMASILARAFCALGSWVGAVWLGAVGAMATKDVRSRSVAAMRFIRLGLRLRLR